MDITTATTKRSLNYANMRQRPNTPAESQARSGERRSSPPKGPRTELSVMLVGAAAAAAQSTTWRAKVNEWKTSYNKHANLMAGEPEPCPVCKECNAPSFCYPKRGAHCYDCGSPKGALVAS